MATSVNFASACTPLEDLIICGLHALFLIFHINTAIISLSLLQLHGAAGCVLRFFLQPGCLFFYIYILYIFDRQSYDKTLLAIFPVETWGSNITAVKLWEGKWTPSNCLLQTSVGIYSVTTFAANISSVGRFLEQVTNWAVSERWRTGATCQEVRWTRAEV